MAFFKVLIFSLLLLCGCQQRVLNVIQMKLEPTYLASTHVGSPDPRVPPRGQMIVAEWWLPKGVLQFSPVLRLHILYNDLSTETVEYSIDRRIGYETYSLVDCAFKETAGFLSYMAEIVTEEGQVEAEWKHQLWVRLIDVDEMSSAVEAKSKQGSVIETPTCISES